MVDASQEAVPSLRRERLRQSLQLGVKICGAARGGSSYAQLIGLRRWPALAPLAQLWSFIEDAEDSAGSQTSGGCSLGGETLLMEC